MSIFEELLARDGKLVYKTKGTSMEPMLRQNRDLVFVEVPRGRLEKYDVALYTRGENYVLHRVIGVCDGYYRIRGDNTYAVEQVADERVIGVLTGFQRKGRSHSADGFGYRLYARLWNAVYPFRFCWMHIERGLIRFAKRIGIAPFLKKLLHRA